MTPGVEAARMRGILLGLLLVAATSACDKETKPLPPPGNRSPEILEVLIRPDRVLADQDAYVSCRARDRDGDFLKFTWSASGGSFPSGNSRSTVRWRTPVSRIPYTVTCVVTDFIDTVHASLEVPIDRVAPPDTLSFINGSNVIELSWLEAADAGVENWRGYEVYAADRSMAELPEDSLLRYRITFEPIDRLNHRVTSVPLGARRYYTIRSRRDYAGFVERSATGPEIETAPRLDGFGRVPVYEIRSRRGAKGIHLPDGSVVPADAADVAGLDLYLGTSDAQDSGGMLMLKSPDRLAYRDPAWAGRVTGFFDLGNDWHLPAPPNDAVIVREIPVTKDDVIGVLTAEGHFGKIRILELAGSSPERRIEFQWAWQPIPGYPRF